MERHTDPCPHDMLYAHSIVNTIERSYSIRGALVLSVSLPIHLSHPSPQPTSLRPYDLTCGSLHPLTPRATQPLSSSSLSHWSRRVLVVSGDGAHGTITVCSSPHMSLISSLSLLNHTCSFPPSPHSCLTIVPLYLVVFLPRRTFSPSGTGFFPPAACPLLLTAWLCSR